eukprot:4232058-Amphidinium_carterae.1
MHPLISKGRAKVGCTVRHFRGDRVIDLGLVCSLRNSKHQESLIILLLILKQFQQWSNQITTSHVGPSPRRSRVPSSLHMLSDRLSHEAFVYVEGPNATENDGSLSSPVECPRAAMASTKACIHKPSMATFGLTGHARALKLC